MEFNSTQTYSKEAPTFDEILMQFPGGEDEIEGDWKDEDDEDFDDQLDVEGDLHEIRVDDDLNEPNPEEDDHLPDDDLQ